MSLQDATNPAAEETVVSPAAEVEQVENQTETNEAPEVDENGEEISPPAPVDDTEEIEHEGLKVRVPKPLKDAFLRFADYTRKTQELGESKRAFEATRDSLTTAHKDYVDALASVKAYDSALSRYENVDWTTLEQQDPTAAAQHWRTFSQLKDARTAAETTAKDTKQRIESDSQRALTEKRTKQFGELKEALPKLIPDFTPETDAKISQFGIAHGYSKEELFEAALQNPKAYAVLNKARLWDEHQAKQSTQKRIEANQAVRPAAEVGSKSPASKNPDRMTTAEWMKYEDAREKAKARGR